MTVEQQVDALTASVEDLKGAVVSKKATLDASVADAQSATAQAQAAKVNALSARDQAGAFKDAAYSAAQSAASAVAYQDLSAIALTKAVTAVDVFIYDTSKDSDGGAWRHRCAGTSWYREPLNTATRGARREFPAIAVIIAEAAKVTIYDGDDPSLPMWMVFEKGGTSGGIFTDGTSQPHTKITSITALNGKLVVGKGLAPANDAWGGITSWDLISECVVKATTRSVGYVGTAFIPLSERNTVTVGPSTFSEPNPRLINNVVNDVDTTVLPNAPIDRASGLPTPTIYAFTDGGISQVGWDGNENTSAVWDSVATASTYGGAKIGGVLPDHRWWASVQQSGSDPDARLVVIGETLTQDVSSTFWSNGSAGTVYAYAEYSALGVSDVKLARKNFSGNEISALAWPAIGGNRGLALLLENAPEPDAGAVAVVGSTFSSGWMVGDIRAAFLADTNDADLIQAGNLCSDPTCTGTATVDAPSGDWAVIGDMADVNTTSPGKIHVKQGVTGYIENVGGVIPAGSAVAVTFTISNSTTTAGVRCVLRGGGVNAAAKSGTYFGVDGKYTVYFSEEEVTGDCYVSFFRFGGHTGTLDIDDISVEIASADRSQKENGLIVNGTITRAPVATGAELVAYSGFSAANYLEQPYSPDLDFGVGDFCVMGWLKLNSTSGGGYWLSHVGTNGSGNRDGWELFGVNGAGNTGSVRFRRWNDGVLQDIGIGITWPALNQWFHLVATRTAGGVLTAYLNGASLGAQSGLGAQFNVSGAPDRVMRVGANFDAGSPSRADMALWRITTTVPTADQIRRIYEDEKALFDENAACTLYGASDAVTALAHDPDTGLDSDGGAWRKRCQHTSWYDEPLNTATRGDRRGFPAVAVLVIDAVGLSIYDGDDPSLPLWMFFQASFGVVRLLARGDNGMLRAVSALNGRIVVASGGSTASVGYDGISIFDFVADTASRFSGSGSNYVNSVSGLAKRNISGYPNGTNTARAIVDRDVNDVAMTVLPDAPVDPTTALPVATIAVATAGGVSVIKSDGSVVDITHTDASGSWAVDLYDDGYLGYNAAGFYHRRPIPVSDTQDGVRYTKKDDDVVFMHAQTPIGAYTGQTAYPPRANSSQAFKCLGRDVIGFSSGLTHIHQDEDSPTGALYAYTTARFFSGWLPGDIKGAFLADTGEGDLVGSGELVTNGKFDTNLTGWTQYDAARGGMAVENGTLRLDNFGIGNNLAQQVLEGLTIGQDYVLTAAIAASAGTTPQIRLGNTAGTSAVGILDGGPNGTGSFQLTFRPQTTSLYVHPFILGGTGSGVYANFDNISVKLADADRSVNNNGMIVNGTITRSPVVTGAELTAYSGFSASNYLEQPYNSALDFGTGDFCMMGWVKGKRSNFNCFLHRNSDKTTAAGLRFMDNGAGQLLVTGYGGGLVGGVYPTTDWFHACFVRKAGVGFIYLNGILAASGVWTANVNDAGATLAIGGYWNNNLLIAGAPLLALWRISATAATPDQIEKIYKDERRLFLPVAQCTLFGTSDAVTALAYDPKTNLLHVGTSQGRSMFDGFVRVANTEMPVGTAISAVNGLIVEE